MSEQVNFEIVKQADLDYGGYEWTTAQIGKDAFGNYWLRAGGGCSCNDISDEEWLPLRDIQQVHSVLDGLYISENFLSEKVQFIAFAQGLL